MISKSRIAWTPIAIKSLKETQVFILENWNTEVLDYFLDLVDKRLVLLKANPKLAPRIEKTQYRRLVVHRHISLFYIYSSDLIKILLVWDNRQDPENLFKKLFESNS